MLKRGGRRKSGLDGVKQRKAGGKYVCNNGRMDNTHAVCPCSQRTNGRAAWGRMPEREA